MTTALYCHGSDTGSQDFHSYKAIETNVTFWEKIYSHYSLTEAVIHDSEDLSKIYEIIPLLGDDLPGASRFNTLFQRQAINKYRKILKKLTTQQPTTREEKRVAALFSQKNRRKELHLALDNVRSQRGQKERFLSGVLHSGKYMGEIKRIFRAYDLPEELAYLPHVESSFNFKAYSKYGAAGIWQFTRSTGKQYLTIDYTLDERLDPIIATHAAARYLENSYQTLNDWPLAITSYNYGLSGMVRAVAELGGYERIFKHYNRGRFGFASKNFYPEFLAAVKVARKIEKNLKDKLEPAQKTRYINLAGYIHINDACRYFGISTETLVSLNPALRPPVIRGEKHIPKGYVLRLPKERKTTRLAASIPQSLYKAAQKPSPYHRVQKGDTAGSIARQHGIPLKKLLIANNLNHSAKIYINQRLILPQPAKKLSSSLPSSRPVLLAKKKQTLQGSDHNVLPKKDPSVYHVANIYRKNGKTYGYITVQPEESLGLYREWLDASGSTLSGLNKLPPDAEINPGQRLLLVFDHLSPKLFTKKRLQFLQEREEDFFSAFTIIGQRMYRVISGDTLWDLCYNRFDIPLWLLRRYNRNISLTSLNKKQELIIPIVEQI